jgi:hypothetical protein
MPYVVAVKIRVKGNPAQPGQDVVQKFGSKNLGYLDSTPLNVIAEFSEAENLAVLWGDIAGDDPVEEDSEYSNIVSVEIIGVSVELSNERMVVWYKNLNY